MKNRTYSISEQTIEQIEELKEKTNQLGLHFDASTIVRIALVRGLPLVLENLSLETTQSVNDSEIAVV